MSILKLDKVSYKYSDGENYVFKDICYDFSLGKTYARKGKSGSGKTTLLSLISGLEHPTDGEVIYNNKNMKEIDLDNYRSREVGIIFQAYNLLPHLTAMENILLAMDISKVDIKNRKEKVLELLEIVGLTEEHANRRVLKLSGGEQQRVAIARSLSYNPKIIIADEPTGNLDIETENEIMEIFKKLAHKENKCIIIVTHSKNIGNQVDMLYELGKIDNKSKKETK